MSDDRHSSGTPSTDSDVLGYIFFSVPPVVTGLRFAGVPLSEFVVIPLVLVAIVFGDAPRWKLPRWLWIPLMGFLWPIAFPGYGLIRRFNGARAHWSLALIALAVSYLLFSHMLDAGSVCRPTCVLPPNYALQQTGLSVALSAPSGARS